MVNEPDEHRARAILSYTKKSSIESEIFDKRYGTNLTGAANDLVNNCLKRSAFKKWLFYEWPKEKLDQVNPPKKIQLPVALRRLISEEDKEEIKRYWDQTFRLYVFDGWNKEFKPVFEP